MKQGAFDPIHQYLRSLRSWLYWVLTVVLIGSIGISIVFASSAATTFLWVWGLASSFVLVIFSVSHALFLRVAESTDLMARWVGIVVAGVAVLVTIGLVTQSIRAMLFVYGSYFVIVTVFWLMARSKA